VLALDAGTSSVRAVAFDAEANPIVGGEAQLSYTLQTTADGGATYPAERLFDLTVQAVDGIVAFLGARTADVAAVGVTSFWHSLMGTDGAARPTTPVLYWADTRSAPDAVALRGQLDAEAVWQRTGCRLHPSYWPAKLRWLARTAPQGFGATCVWLSFAEYALVRLCDAPASAVTICMASGTGLLDVHSLTWDDPMLAAAGISVDRLSPLVDLGPPGRLRDEVAARWPGLAAAAWFPALGDGACANVGSGAIGPSRIALTVGTSGAMRLILPLPPGAPWSVPQGLWAYRLDRCRAVLGGALSNGGNLLRWVWETTGTEAGDAVTAAAVALPPDATGLTFLPFLAGVRSPGWYGDATGTIAGVTLATRPEHLIRAAMEAVAYRFAAIYDALCPLASEEHQIVVSGGGILGFPAWLQITADVLGRPLIALAPGDETTARGAALMAAVERGILPSLDAAPDGTEGGMVYRPDTAHHDRYRAGRQRQARLERSLVEAGELA
jgi:gluconokinase